MGAVDLAIKVSVARPSTPRSRTKKAAGDAGVTRVRELRAVFADVSPAARGICAGVVLAVLFGIGFQPPLSVIDLLTPSSLYADRVVKLAHVIDTFR
jgi:hypothetical protein